MLPPTHPWRRAVVGELEVDDVALLGVGQPAGDGHRAAHLVELTVGEVGDTVDGEHPTHHTTSTGTKSSLCLHRREGPGRSGARRPRLNSQPYAVRLTSHRSSTALRPSLSHQSSSVEVREHAADGRPQAECSLRRPAAGGADATRDPPVVGRWSGCRVGHARAALGSRGQGLLALAHDGGGRVEEAPMLAPGVVSPK